MKRLNIKKKPSPVISIIIPSFNEEKVIGDTLQQFLPYKEQFRLELIVADARSSDSTVKIARKYADKVLVEERRRNIASGRNLGCFAARGKILFCTDADIRIPEPERFFHEVLAAFEDRDVVGVTGPLRIYEEEETFADRAWHAVMNGVIRVAVLMGGLLSKGESNIVRATAVRAVNGYDERINVGEDGDLFRRLARIGRVKYIPCLLIRHSPRRFRKEGYFKLIFINIREGISLWWRNKSYLRTWRVVR